MKKLNLWVALGLMTVAGLAYAGNQYNWGTSTGASWSTPDDTTVTANQALSIGNSSASPIVIPANAISLGSSIVAQSTAVTTGNSVGVFGTLYLSGTVPAIEGSVLCATTAVTGLAAATVCPITGGIARQDWIGVAKAAASTGSIVNVYYAGFVLAATTQTVVAGDVLSVSSTTAGYLYASTSFQNLTSTSAMVGNINGVVGVAQASGVSAGGLTKIRLR